MASTYFKRFRMEADLVAPRRPVTVTPVTVTSCDGADYKAADYKLVAWNEALIDAHARTKYRSFCDEIDAMVFPCLGDLEGCRRLMREIRRKPGFLPEATWLIAMPVAPGEHAWCGTIQGVMDASGTGMIQNVGVVPGHRRRGLGVALVEQALAGFIGAGARKASLEVTADNETAIRLYRRLGFRRARTVYKVVDRGANELATPMVGAVANNASARASRRGAAVLSHS